MANTIQEQLLAARRNQILDAAIAVFAEKGFHAATTKDIAKAAEISEGTIYKYFESKTSLLLAILERMRDAALSDSVPKSLEAPDFPTFLRMYLHQPLLELRKSDFALFRVIISEAMVNLEFRRLYEEQILRPNLELDEKYFQEQAAKYGLRLSQPQLVVRFIATLILGLIMEEVLGAVKSDEALDEFLNYAIDLILVKIKSEET